MRECIIRHAVRAAVLVLAFSSSSPCLQSAHAASTIDTLIAQMNQAAANQRADEGLAAAQKLEPLIKRQGGANTMNYAGVLTNEGMFLVDLGRFREGADKLNAALAIKLRFNDAGSTIRTAGMLVDALMALERRSEARTVAQQALAIGTAAFGPDDPRLADAITAMGLIVREDGNYKEAEDDFRRALAIRQKTPDDQPFDIALAMDYLGDLYGREGRFDDGEKTLQQALALLDRAYGAGATQAPNYAKTLGDLGYLYRDAGRLTEAETALRKVLAILRAQSGDNDPNLAAGIGDLGLVLTSQSRFAEAEDLFNQSLVIYERLYGPNSPAQVSALTNLAGIYESEGRTAEAAALQQRVLAINEKAAGADSVAVARSLAGLATSYRKLGRPTDALPLYQRALTIFSQKSGEASEPAADVMSMMGRSQIDTGQLDDAARNFTRALTIHEQILGPQHQSLIADLRGLADLDIGSGRYAEARAYLQRAWTIAQTKFGAGHLITAAITDSLADISVREKNWPEALTTLRGTAAQLDPGLRFPNLDIRLIPVIWNVSNGHPDDALRSEAFVSAQRLHETQAGAALTAMSARFAAGNNAVAALVRRQQDLKAQLDKLDKRISGELGAPDGKRNDALIVGLRAESARARKALDETTAQIQRQFPAYVELSSPAPLTLAQVQALLKPDEALVSFVVLKEQSYVFAVTREGSTMQQIALGAAELSDRIGNLRRGLFNGVSEVAPFDLDASHDLYAALFGGIESLIAKEPKLLVVPTASLTSLPFQVLVTRKPDPGTAPADRYRTAAWLNNDKAISVLPSVTSLRALRVYAKASRAAKPFIGFGNPLLQRTNAGTAKAASRGVQPYQDYFRGSVVDLDVLRRGLAPLPETADELRAVAHALGASDADVRVGEAATVTNVRLAGLDQYRVVDFATHGLVAGEVNGLSEPALVLTLPEHPTADDDGLLTASRVATLTLDADWAVLSACNTAAGDKPGAEGLSGLARAFFYAGARALLVSHWPVDSEAAVKLTTAAFSELAKDPGIGRAEALRRSMKKLIADTSSPRNADPSMWAPFVLVGEGD